MKLTTLDADLKIHQKLEDEPNDVGGLSAHALKEKFDQAGLTIQQYLNEVHLPEEEQAAREAVEEAKAYTDQKTEKLGKGDMTRSIYDPQRRQTDVYAYADAKANEAKAEAKNRRYVFGAISKGLVRNGITDKLTLESVVDPMGLWNAKTSRWTAPSGAKAMMIHLHVRWGRQIFSQCYIRVKVNGEARLSVHGPLSDDGKLYSESMALTVAVEGGDEVGFSLEAEKIAESLAEIRIIDLYAEFIL